MSRFIFSLPIKGHFVIYHVIEKNIRLARLRVSSGMLRQGIPTIMLQKLTLVQQTLL